MLKTRDLRLKRVKRMITWFSGYVMDLSKNAIKNEKTTFVAEWNSFSNVLLESIHVKKAITCLDFWGAEKSVLRARTGNACAKATSRLLKPCRSSVLYVLSLPSMR